MPHTLVSDRTQLSSRASIDAIVKYARYFVDHKNN